MRLSILSHMLWCIYPTFCALSSFATLRCNNNVKRKQVITCAIGDPGICLPMASLGQNYLNMPVPFLHNYIEILSLSSFFYSSHFPWLKVIWRDHWSHLYHNKCLYNYYKTFHRYMISCYDVEVDYDRHCTIHAHITPEISETAFVTDVAATVCLPGNEYVPWGSIVHWRVHILSLSVSLMA